MARPDEPEDMDMINDTAPEDEAFSVIGAGGDEEQNLIEKMVLEIDEDIEPDDIEDPDLNAAVEEMARERKRQQRGLDEQE